MFGRGSFSNIQIAWRGSAGDGTYRGKISRLQLGATFAFDLQKLERIMVSVPDRPTSSEIR